MSLLRKSRSTVAAEVEPEPDVVIGKGRPTPKRRDRTGVRGPVTAPQTRKEAYARQREQTRSAKAARSKPAGQMTVAERRAAMNSGDPSALPKRDQGPTRKLARDYVDSRRSIGNYFLIVLPLLVVSAVFGPIGSVVVLVLAVIVGVEWYMSGKRVRAMAMERFGAAEGSNMSIGMYCGSRAYLPRRWRLPKPQVSLGDTI